MTTSSLASSHGDFFTRFPCRQLEQRFPGRGRHVFAHMTLLSAAELFYRLVEDDQLAEILNAGLQGRGVPFRMIRTN
jgi:hypothetical protein